MDEELYDKEIAPVLAQIAQRLKDNNLSFIALCEFAEGSSGLTASLKKSFGVDWRIPYIACQTRDNIDAFFLQIIKHAEVHGHSSVYLKMLGVPEKPHQFNQAS